ncbi:energy transducer TonB [sulfur-oxidizing endosymbiont of Gigantopelta aegis]|uniref:energy transducer TonB n=1 Tax=sulfur-oxidizing endosymbiont of Gigantopelta aegis TaxID=2794934 RepID=UPI0018DCC47B|nr:energy transducer TonB [sulfur-oxidizing endosymbiont of Gigantopelta aegis]
MPIIRYFSTFVIGALFTLLLFVVMQKMLTFKQVEKQSTISLNGLDFVRLIREQTTEKKPQQVQPPKQPDLPDNRPPAPKLPPLQVMKPQLAPIVSPMPKIKTQLNLNEALYLGDFTPNQTLATPISNESKAIINKSIINEIMLDEEVVALVRIAPIYPSRAARIGIEGWVKMEILINQSGRVESVKVLAAKPENIFNRAAIKAMKRWRFRPKIVAGKAVSRTAQQQINFKLSK